MFQRILAATVATPFALTSAHAAPSDSLKMYNNRLFVPVAVNGVEAEALLDSAAEMTFVDPRLAAKLKLKAEGNETAKGSGGNSTVEPDGRKLPLACHRGIGRSILRRFVLTIGFPGHAVWFKEH